MTNLQTDIPALTKLVNELFDIAAAQPSHQLALQALISAYMSVAVCHPCCAQWSIDVARSAADFIGTKTAASRPRVH